MEKKVGQSRRGEFDPNAWIEEGDGLFASAELLRASWHNTREKIHQRSGLTLPRDEATALFGYPRSSVLLLGYAVETYLKAGLAKWLWGCPESLFDLSIRSYSHGYQRLAKHMEIEASIAPPDLLDFLEKAVTLNARYPARSDDGETDIQAANRISSSMWSDEKFLTLSKLATDIKDRVVRMSKGDICLSVQRPKEGYIVMRLGGLLPSRVVAHMPESTDPTIYEIKEILKKELRPEVNAYYLDQCDFFVVPPSKANQRNKGGRCEYGPLRKLS